MAEALKRMTQEGKKKYSEVSQKKPNTAAIKQPQ